MAFDDGVKTVSGSVAHTDDAAAKVPFVSLKCGIAPTLTGKSAIECTQTGKNLINWKVSATTFEFDLPSGNYTFSVDGTLSSGNWYFRGYDADGNPYTDKANLGLGSAWTHSSSSHWNYAIGSLTSFTFSVPNGCSKLEIFKQNADETISAQIEVGSTATTYEPYVAPTTHTAQLGRTIYGGTADIVNGTGTDENNKFTVTSDMSDSIRYVGSGDTAYIQINKTPASNGRWQDLVCSHFTHANIYAGGTQQGIGCYSSQFYIRDSQFASKQDFLDFLDEQEALGTPLEICYKLATPTDFTFTPITPTPETVGKVNNVYCDTGDTELTYYDNAHGFSEVTVNKTGKNLFGGWTKGYGINSTTGEIFSRQDSAISDYISVVPNTNYYISGFSNEISSMVAYYDRNKTYISRTSGSQRLSLAVTTPTNCRYMILYQYRAGDQTASIDVIDNMQTQLEFGSERTEYEPYVEPVSKTAYLHKVIYGGQADVIKGVCEPKNLFVKDNPNKVDGYITTTGFSTGNTNAKTIYIPIVGGETYTVSKTAGQRFQLATAEVIPSNGAVFTGRQAGNTNTSLTITASANDKYLWAWVFLDGTDTGTLADMLASVQIEKGSSASEYVPGFEPFTFPPISMSTDEGENTLFANEGASAITYRKETD